MSMWLGLGILMVTTGWVWRNFTSSQELEQGFKLRVEMGSWDYPYIEWVEYGDFSVGDLTTKYILHVGQFTGNTSYEAIGYDDGHPFTTSDMDNDRLNGNCAAKDGGGGGWWYARCAFTFPTAAYGGGYPYMFWHRAFGEDAQSLKHMIWKITTSSPTTK